jgi:hypothetical protein
MKVGVGAVDAVVSEDESEGLLQAPSATMSATAPQRSPRTVSPDR